MINEKLVKEEKLNDNDGKISGINIVLGKKNAIKGIKSNETYRNLQAQGFSKFYFHTFNI